MPLAWYFKVAWYSLVGCEFIIFTIAGIKLKFGMDKIYL